LCKTLNFCVACHFETFDVQKVRLMPRNATRLELEAFYAALEYCKLFFVWFPRRTMGTRKIYHLFSFTGFKIFNFSYFKTTVITFIKRNITPPKARFMKK